MDKNLTYTNDYKKIVKVNIVGPSKLKLFFWGQGECEWALV